MAGSALRSKVPLHEVHQPPEDNMKRLVSAAFATFSMAVALAGYAKDDDLRSLEYTFSVEKDDDQIAILSKLQEEIEKALKVIDIDDPKEWVKSKEGQYVDCLKFIKGQKPGTARYLCTTSDKVFKVMADEYYKSLDAKSPVNTVSMTATPTAIRCSASAAQGCKHRDHPNRQPCYFVTAQDPVYGFYCRHTPYTFDHTCF
jgi:hypothetical protein